MSAQCIASKESSQKWSLLIEGVFVALLMLLLLNHREVLEFEAGPLFMMYSAFALGIGIFFYNTGHEKSLGDLCVSALGITGAVAAGVVIGISFMTPDAAWWFMVILYAIGIRIASCSHLWKELIIPRISGYVFETFITCVVVCLMIR